MKQIHWILLIYFLCSGISSRAQKENHIWTFGFHCGLDFNAGGPVRYMDSCYTVEGSAAVCNAAGQLLFYCDGTKAYDRFHDTLLNGMGLLGSISTTQGVAIASVAGLDSVYYLFTLDAYGSSGKLLYSLVDMRLNGGLGGIPPTQKNILIDSGRSEKMIIAGNCETQWLITHHRDSGIFYAYNLNTSAFTPVISYTGPSRGSNNYVAGEMKASPDFSKIALANYWTTGSLQLYDFNMSTGMVSGYQSLDSGFLYGVEFSADGSKLYASSSVLAMTLHQFDLSAGSLAAIRASKYNVNPGTITFGMRRGPDDMIYLARGDNSNFSRIRNPNLAGIACNPEKDILTTAPPVPGAVLGFGNYFIPRQDNNPDTTYNRTDLPLCSGDTAALSGRKGHRHFHWDNGDTTLSRTVTGPGIYWVMSSGLCGVWIDTFAMTASGKSQSSFKDTAVCTGALMTINGQPGADTYLWNDGSTGPARTFDAEPGTYWVMAKKGCDRYADTVRIREKVPEVSRKETDSSICFRSMAILHAPGGYDRYLWSNGNTGPDTSLYASADIGLAATDTKGCRILQQIYHISFVSFSRTIPDTLVCNDNPIILDADMATPGASYRWSTGATTPQVTVSEPGNYFAHITIRGCTLTDTVTVNQKTLELSIGPDQQACRDRQLVLSSDVADAASYRWSTGDTGKSIQVTESGHYVLTIEKDGCSASDETDIRFVNCDNCIAFPNAFTPNQDGINDYFKPLLNCPPKTYDFSIYNRWGQEIFHTVNPVDSWNGQYNGMPADGNVYFYLLKVSYIGQDDAIQLFKGETILVR